MKRTPLKKTAQNLLLFVGTLLFCFLATEAGYRLLDPFPYFIPTEINQSEYGNLSMHDEVLGWRGVPSARVEFVTVNNRIQLTHNREGFRDVDHGESSAGKPAIVFLGDSFTWGYEVEFGDMFVNRLRRRLPEYEIFNLAHRGYGTDQSLLTFRAWQGPRHLKRVILMFSENDIDDNNSTERNRKPKPKFRQVDDELILTGVPVPEDERWKRPIPSGPEPESRAGFLKRILFKSHFLHDLYFRYRQFFVQWVKESENPDLRLTVRILEELKGEVEKRGGVFTVVFIPSKLEIEHLGDLPPYQKELVEICRERGIDCLDLAPAFEKAWLRTYYRHYIHWNDHGHEVAAVALFDFIAGK